MSTIIRTNVHTCAKCGRVFETSWEDDDAVRELRKNFPGAEKEDCDIVCDACYDQLMEELR